MKKFEGAGMPKRRTERHLVSELAVKSRAA